MPVLCGIDFSDNSRKALRRAARLARDADGELLLLHAAETSDEEAFWRHFVETPWEVPKRTEKRARARLEAFYNETVDTAERPDTVDFRVELLKAHRAMLDVEEERDFDWIVLGATGQGRVASILLGSTAEKVVRECAAPVMVVPNDATDEPRWSRILAPVDFSEDSAQALERAIEMARTYDAHLDLLHAYTWPATGLGYMDMKAHPDSVEAFEERRWEQFEEFLEDFDFEGVDASHHLRLASPYAAILDVIEDAEGEQPVDVVCMGTRGKSGVERLVLGSVTAKVLRTMPAEVVVMHAGF